VKTSILKLFRLPITNNWFGGGPLFDVTHTRHADTLKRAVAA